MRFLLEKAIEQVFWIEYHNVHMSAKPYRFLKPVRFGIFTKFSKENLKTVKIKKTASTEAVPLLINLTINLIFPVA